MKIFLLGYMASGKSTIGKKLAKIINYDFIDLDNYIEAKEGKSIKNIFSDDGEIKFRKLERFYLEELIDKKDNLLISLGGGTPCYYDSMSLIQKDKTSLSIYLKVSLNSLVSRLIKEKSTRPLIKNIANEKLNEFIGKHLFERSFFYNQATLKVQNDAEEDTINEILNYLSKQGKL